MKKKLIIYASLLSFLTFGVFFSCQKKEEKPAEKTVTSEQVDQAKGIKQDEPPRSQKKFGEFESNGSTVAPPATYNNAQNAGTQEKLQILSSSSSPAGARMKSTGIGGWKVETVNGQTLASEFLIFFDVDGTYIYFDYETGNWDWGYYYINKALTLIVFDPGTQWEDAWTISSLTSTTFTIKNDNLDVIVFENYLLDGYEEEVYATSDINAILTAEKWYSLSFDSYSYTTCDMINPYEYDVLNADGTGYTDSASIITDRYTWKTENNQLIINSTTSGIITFNIDYAYEGQIGLSYYDVNSEYYTQIYLMNWTDYYSYYKTEIDEIKAGTIDCSGTTSACDECTYGSGCYDEVSCAYIMYDAYQCGVCSDTTYNDYACTNLCPQ